MGEGPLPDLGGRLRSTLNLRLKRGIASSQEGENRKSRLGRRKPMRSRGRPEELKRFNKNQYKCGKMQGDMDSG